jgi:hypothetical protein
MSDRTRRESTRCSAALCSIILSLSACFASHGPKDATETGNPPVIDSRRVSLKLSSSSVHITGDEGAVKPGGTPIEITNLTTGAVTKAKANADGSFDVRVNGSPNDAFVVRAGTGQGGAASAPVYVVRGSAAVGSGTDGSLSCEQRDSLARATFDRALAEADKGCAIDADCHVVDEIVDCENSCPGAAVSAAGVQALAATAAAIDAGLCANHATDDCHPGDVSCSSRTVACVAGQCTSAMAAIPPPTCLEREQIAGQQIAQAIQTADTSCTVNADCVTVSTATVCTDACGPTVVSRSGQSAIDTAVTSIDEGLCSSFVADGCHFSALPCAAPVTGVAICSNGFCVLRAGSPTTPIDCTSCLAETLEWGNNGRGFSVDERSTLEPCAHYTHRRVAQAGTLMACENDFEECTAVTNRGALLAALAHADVQRALASSPVTYGDDQAQDAPIFEIKNGARLVNVAWPCSDNQASCIPVPAGVKALVDLLQTIDQVELSSEECRSFLGECNVAFEAGTGSAGTQIFWHDPDSQACLPRTYNGSGGNVNRFDSRVACEVHCGTPPGAEACAWNRSWQTVCTQCAPSLGCISTAQACAKPCTADVDCASDSIGNTCSANHVCEAASSCGM